MSTQNLVRRTVVSALLSGPYSHLRHAAHSIPLGVLLLAAAAVADDRIQTRIGGLSDPREGGKGAGPPHVYVPLDTHAGSMRNTASWVAPLSDATSGGVAGGCSNFLDAGDGVEGDAPIELAFLDDGSAVVVANKDSSTVTFIDPQSGAVTHTVAVGGGPVDIKVSPDGQYVLTANARSNSVSVVDVATHAHIAEVPITGDDPYALYISADSMRAYVGVINDACFYIDGVSVFLGCAAEQDGVPSTISEIDLASFTEVQSFVTAPQGQCGWGFAPIQGMFVNCLDELDVSEPTNRLVFQDWLQDHTPAGGTDGVILYDLTTGTQITRIDMGSEVMTDLDLSPDGLTAVAVTFDGIMKKINVQTGAATTFSIPTDVHSVRVAPNGTTAVLVSQDIFNPGIVFINLTNGAVLGTVAAPIHSSSDLEFSFDGQYLIASGFSLSVTRVSTRTLLATMATDNNTYELAVSPTAHRAAALATWSATEIVTLYDTNGAAAHTDARVLTGGAPEGDQTRAIGLAACSTAAATNIYSTGVSLFGDLSATTASAHVATGARLGSNVWDVALTPDGAFAIATNSETYQLSIIDTAAGTVAAQFQVPLPTDGYDIGLDRVLVSADGQTAYVSEIGGTVDSILFVNLNGSASTIEATLPVGNLGYVILPTLSLTSAIRFSPDESLLAVCSAQTDELVLVDRVNRTIVARVPTGGDAPIDVVFAPDGLRAYVLNIGANAPGVAVINIAGASSVLESVVPMETPAAATIDTNGDYLYVGTWGPVPSDARRAVQVLDTESLQIVATIPVPIAPGAEWNLPPQFGVVSFPRAMAFDPQGGRVLVLSNEFLLVAFGFAPPARVGLLTVIDAAGPASQEIETIELLGGATDLEFCVATQRALFAQYGRLDGLEIVCLAPGIARGDANCDGSIDFFDIDPFLLALFDLPAYQAAYCGGSIEAADVDCSGAVDFFDIDLLVACLFDTCPACP